MIIDEILKAKILPVIQMDDVGKVDGLAKALSAAGLQIAEVTLRHDNAINILKEFSNNHPDIILGAGTVLSIRQVDNAINGGAKFIISPGLNPKIVKYCQRMNVAVFPGVCTPTDIEMALELGLDTLKFFPAEASGGLNMIKALSGPYKNIKFIPTGGIDADNISEYLEHPNVIACGGSWMVRPDLIANGKFDDILSLTKQAVRLVR